MTKQKINTRAKKLKEIDLIKIINDRYEYRDGNFYVKYRYNPTVQVGERAGCFRDGYRVLGIFGVSYEEHRLVWLFKNGAWPTGHIDHINRNRSDNRIENLRDVSRSLNMQNVISARKNNKSSGYLGVYFHKQSRRFCARIRHNDRRICLGYFKTAKEASEAYLSAKRVYHKDAVDFNCAQQKTTRANHR